MQEAQEEIDNLDKKSVPEIAFYLQDSTFYGQFLKDLFPF